MNKREALLSNYFKKCDIFSKTPVEPMIAYGIHWGYLAENSNILVQLIESSDILRMLKKFLEQYLVFYLCARPMVEAKQKATKIC